MSDEEIRMAVAKLCGTMLKNGRLSEEFWFCTTCLEEVDANHGHKHSIVTYERRVPNYPEDLNAMHDAVEQANIPDKKWSDALMNVIRDDPGWGFGAVEARYRTAKATARQRAEAFLRVHGKWQEARGK